MASMMSAASRDTAITAIQDYFDNGSFREDLARRVAIKTESPEPDQRPELYRYLEKELTPYLSDMGFECVVHENPRPDGGPFLVATRTEDPDLPTVMTYGHGDVVRGYDDQWREGLNPWTMTEENGRWYGRGTADNKAQHSINLAAIKTVLEQRGHLGFNIVALIETGEECGSPGLKDFCAQNKDLFKADVFIASDGPRLRPEQPTIFMGSRGVFNFTMTLELRDGGHHSGNWGGLLANPGIMMAHALATITDARGKLLIEEWRPEPMTNSVRRAISKLKIDGGENAPEIDENWGEPGLTPEEKVFGSNTFEVRSFVTGNPRNPVNAIPPKAVAHGHIRYVAGTDPMTFLPSLRKHLDAHGFEQIELAAERDYMNATRLDPDHPWAQFAIKSIEKTTEQEVAVLPNLGGTLPNDVFAEVLDLPTIWVPHSYAGCSQHAPNEHVLPEVCRQGLQMMTGLWWDLGGGDTPKST